MARLISGPPLPWHSRALVAFQRLGAPAVARSGAWAPRAIGGARQPTSRLPGACRPPTWHLWALPPPTVHGCRPLPRSAAARSPARRHARPQAPRACERWEEWGGGPRPAGGAAAFPSGGGSRPACVQTRRFAQTQFCFTRHPDGQLPKRDAGAKNMAGLFPVPPTGSASDHTLHAPSWPAAAMRLWRTAFARRVLQQDS